MSERMNENTKSQRMEEMDGRHDARDVLVGRVVDGEASGTDWAQIREIAADDPGVFQEIAELQELRRQLTAYVDDAGEVAERVSLPMHLHPRIAPAGRLRMTGIWGGWAVAALVAVAWMVGVRPTDPVIVGDAGQDMARGGLAAGAIDTAGEALDRYLELGKQSGTVVGELPSGIVLEKQPLPDGSGYDVLYLRQFIERARVTTLLEEVETEDGKSVIVPRPISNPVVW